MADHNPTTSTPRAFLTIASTEGVADQYAQQRRPAGADPTLYSVVRRGHEPVAAEAPDYDTALKTLTAMGDAVRHGSDPWAVQIFAPTA